MDPIPAWKESAANNEYRRTSDNSLPVAIIGAGVAGLRIAMMLNHLDIPYDLFEASQRH
ncbi:hypothetical protein H0H87_005559, partial [Tephrocybe sp. NHM501043]